MSRNFQSLIISLAFVLIVAASGASGQRGLSSPPPNGAQSFRLRGVDGRTYDLSEMRGEVVLVSFGATWCAPCSAELVALEALMGEYAGRPVRFFWVSTDGERTSNAIIRNYARERGLTMPVLRDPNQTTFMQFASRARIPMVVFFDREGRLNNPVHFGMSTPDAYRRTMRRRIDALLETAPGASAQIGAERRD